MPDPSFLFVHSPLVGPSSLRRLADAAAATGHSTVLPDLTSAVGRDDPHRSYRSAAVDAARSLPGPPVVVGHSGAGAFLPSIGSAVDRCAGLVFLDAVVPPEQGRHRTPDGVLALLDAQTVDGVLRRWLDWWPGEVVERLLPDPPDVEELARDMPRVPRAFYDVDVDVPDGWSRGPCGYLQLSGAYAAEFDEATRRGWPATSIDTTHLGQHTATGLVLRALLGLVDQLGAG